MTDNLMWDYNLQCLFCCYSQPQIWLKSNFPRRYKKWEVSWRVLWAMTNETRTISVNPTFGQQIIFVELSWSSLILQAVYTPKKKKMEILLSEDFFPEIMPASKIHSQPFKSHMNSLPENSTFANLYISLKLFSWLIQGGYIKSNSSSANVLSLKATLISWSLMGRPRAQKLFSWIICSNKIHHFNL